MNPFPAIHPLATLNALLNAVATLLLITGWLAILAGRWRLHRGAMAAAFATSGVFLASYLVYHALEGSRRYAGPESLRVPYYAILLTHVVLAATVPLLAARMFFLAWKRRWQDHRRVGRLTMPIWLYVSVTGVIIYVMLYHLPPADAPPPPAAAGRTLADDRRTCHRITAGVRSSGRDDRRAYDGGWSVRRSSRENARPKQNGVVDAGAVGAGVRRQT